MDTFGLFGDTQSPFSFLGYLMPKLFVLRDGDEPTTFTQAELDTKVAEAVGAAKAGQGNWYDTLPQDIKANPTITRYKSGEEFAKGHLELEKTMGLKGTLVPVESSSDEVRAKFFKDIGRPDNAEGYTSPVMEGLHESIKLTQEQDVGWFKKLAFDAGLNGKQHDAIYKAYLELQSQRLTEYDKTLSDQSNQAGTDLRNKWGGTYDERLALSNGLVKKFGAEKADSLMTKFGSDPEAIEFLYNLGSQLSEDKLGEIGRSGLGMHPEEAKTEINKLMKVIMETKPDDPIYKDLLAKKNTLYKIAYPPKQAATV